MTTAVPNISVSSPVHNDPDISGSGCPEIMSLIQWGAEGLLVITVTLWCSSIPRQVLRLEA
jgi:hypothetical protein